MTSNVSPRVAAIREAWSNMTVEVSWERMSAGHYIGTPSIGVVGKIPDGRRYMIKRTDIGIGGWSIWLYDPSWMTTGDTHDAFDNLRPHGGSFQVRTLAEAKACCLQHETEMYEQNRVGG